jgi:hypothetical protein
MADTLKSFLATKGVLARVALDTPGELLLRMLKIEAEPTLQPGPDQIYTGSVSLNDNFGDSPLPGFDFSLGVPTGVVDPAPFKLLIEPSAFRLWVVLAQQGDVFLGYRFLERLPGMALTAAEVVEPEPGRKELKQKPGARPMLVSRSEEPGSKLAPSLLVKAKAGEPTEIRFTPDTDSTEGVVSFGLEPDAILFGGSGIGFRCPAITIDDSTVARAPGPKGAPGVRPPRAEIEPDKEIWRGLVARELEFFLPPSLPFIGEQPLRGYLAIPFGDASPELVIEDEVPPREAADGKPARPGYTVRIECRDPTARGLSGFLPTLIAASVELPLDGAKAEVPGHGPLTFASGKPVRARIAIARNATVSPPAFRVTIGVAAHGKDGLLSLTTGAGTGTFDPAKLFNTAAAMATALMADSKVARGPDGKLMLSALAAAGTAVSSLFEPDSRFVLHGAELETGGEGQPIGGPVSLTLDYSVAVRVIKLSIPGDISVQMKPEQPMRIRVRRVRLSINPAKSGLDMIDLDYDRAEMEIENPGAWDIGGLERLFDVVGSRSGRGSAWVEVDLRFKLNLGPVRVSGMTLRAALRNGPVPEVTVSGLEAGLNIPAAIDGKGALHLLKGGFDARLAATIEPLELSAKAGIIYTEKMLVLDLGVDLPAPIPLASSGFGLFGIGGRLAFNAVPDFGNDPKADPVLRQLKWKADTPNAFKNAPGQSTFGFDAVVGTLPDFGFTFGTKAGLLISVPDVAVRGALNGGVLRPRPQITDDTATVQKGVSFIGFIGVDSKAVSFGVLGSVDLPPLLEIRVPLAGYFPLQQPEKWYVHLGADGYPGEGRAIGPISATVLPGLLDLRAEAYLMVRGNGITDWPYGRHLPGKPLTLNSGFVLAFGFAAQTSIGVKPIAWAEIFASLDLLIGAKPPTLAGFGRAGGSLNLGPFSIGVQALITFAAQKPEGGAWQTRLWAEVRAKIELFFFDIEGTVTIAFGDEVTPKLPPPDRHPLDRFDAAGKRVGSLPVLTDDSYQVLDRLAENPEAAPVVWPDALVSIPFAATPAVKKPADTDPFPGIGGPDAPKGAARIGSEVLRYEWRLDGLNLVDVTDEVDKRTGAGTALAGQLSARWQAPRPGGDVTELLLFSTSGDLWMNRVAVDGAKPPKPLTDNAEICRRGVEALPGWAVGRLARPAEDGLLLPPDPVSMDPYSSRVEARLRHYAIRFEPNPRHIIPPTRIPLHAMTVLPAPYEMVPAAMLDWKAPLLVKDKAILMEERSFAGALALPMLTLPPFEQDDKPAVLIPRQEVALCLTEPITQGVLILAGSDALLRRDELQVTDASGPWQLACELPFAEGIALVFRQNSATPAAEICVSWSVGVPLALVGLHGLTIGAAAAAAQETQALQDLAALLGKAADDGPKTDPIEVVPHKRVILKPDRLYRLDVKMSWSGWLYRQDEGGNAVEVDHQLDQETLGPGGPSTSRSFFFRTARPAPSPAKKRGEKDFVTWLHDTRSDFHPEMIERYFGGYEPTQSETFRFCDDPLRANFKQDHVPALAQAYSYDLVIAVRRVDRPDVEHAKPSFLMPSWSFALDRRLLDGTDAMRHDLAVRSPCKLPKPGATASALTPLEPEAWYEVYVAATKDAKSKEELGRLPGVTFRTSRWRGPEGMLAGLGWTVGAIAPASVLTGDIALVRARPEGAAVVEGDDVAFQRALRELGTTPGATGPHDGLGLDGWPVATEPRLTRLWTASASGEWLFAGLLLEAPEPIHRAGRLEFGADGLMLSMGMSGANVTFGIRRRDRAGTRLLWLTEVPFKVVTQEFVHDRIPPRRRLVVPGLILTGRGVGAGAGGATGTLLIPTQPDFAGEP